KAGSIRSVVLGADLVAGLPVKEKILGQNGRLEVVLAPIDSKLPPARILAAGVQAFRQREQEQSNLRVEELFSPGKRQVFFGAVEILNALRETKPAGVLVLDEALHQEAPVCGRCSAVTIQTGVCPDCAGPVERSYLENELVCLAASSGAEIEFVKDSEALAKKGGAGFLV
ncbi:MAG TPA: hypothetical protein VFR89_06450, partial [candidate division Zixibacteria bacterium]|nr:hypothetical protein [candidate division Zixibacteria bacterium]